MVEVFIDEGGQFTLTSGWSAVCALVVPDTQVGRLRRKLTYQTRVWPKAPTGELKGGLLEANHLSALVEQLFAREALLFVVAIDMASENDERLNEHKRRQSELLTAFLTPEHHINLVQQVRELRRTLERMPIQLYVQSLLMTELTAIVVEEAALYFSQRHPRELGNFTWTIDAKDPRRITTQELWWRDTLGPLQESRSRREPLGRVDDPRFNDHFFDQAYEFQKMVWHPDKPREPVTGYDIRKIISNNISFKDSRSDILIQAIDILTNFVRRLLIGRIYDPSVAPTLGRLQIYRRREGVYQSINLLSLTGEGRLASAQLARMIKQMSLAGRSMIRR
jgi:hypothetical protein